MSQNNTNTKQVCCVLWLSSAVVSGLLRHLHTFSFSFVVYLSWEISTTTLMTRICLALLLFFNSWYGVLWKHFSLPAPKNMFGFTAFGKYPCEETKNWYKNESGSWIWNWMGKQHLKTTENRTRMHTNTLTCSFYLKCQSNETATK